MDSRMKSFTIKSIY